MPERNRFLHQPYPTAPLQTPTRHVLDVRPRATDYSRLHTRHGVRRVILVPGTFAGNDPFNISGTMRAVAERLPAGGAVLQRLADRVSEKTHEIFSGLAADVGNYSPEYAARFEELVGGDPAVGVLEPKWSGQNHHFARADLAVRLFAELDRMELFGREQILLWGHSHAGNGFALLSNLLGGDPESVEDFFEACGYPEAEHWQRACRSLRSNPSPHPLARHVSVVTFGTPVRYGWDPLGLSGIYHILFDRNQTDPGNSHGRPMFPPHPIPDMLDATYGDWVQAFAIAGTDVVPPAPGPLERNRRLDEFLRRGLDPPELTLDTRLIPVEHLRWLCARWKTGTRCHTDGRNLLVDYQPGGRLILDRPIESSVFGHGVATTIDWLPAHLELLLRQMDLDAA